MRFVTDMSKGVLGSPDSPVLWTDILSNVPDSLLLKPDFKALCVACGHCTEAVLIAKRMQSLGIPNERIQDAIWVLDKYPVFTNQARCYGFKNTITADFLLWEPKGMKFDLVMGNPPYQTSISSTASSYIFQKFIHKCVDLKPEMFCFIIPDNWIIRNDKMGRMIRSDLKTMGLKKIEGISSSVFSSVSINPCYIICEKGYNGKVEMIETFITDFDKNLIDKICSKEKTGVEVKDCIRLPVGCYAIVSAFRSVDVRNNPLNPIILKEITPNQTGSAYAAFKYGKKEEMDKCLIFYKNFYESNLVRYLLKKTRTSYGLRSPQLSYIPKMPMNRTWTDQELYAHFGLTDEEIRYIEEQVK